MYSLKKICPVRFASLALGIFLITAAPAALAATNADCLACHDGTLDGMSPDDLAEMVVPAPEGFHPAPKRHARTEKPSLTIDAKKFAASIHGEFACTDCHADVGELPHAAKLDAVGCAACHEDASAKYENSVHAVSVANGNGDSKAALCADCHGTHDIRPMADPENRVAKSNVAATCAKCHHEDVELAGRRGGNGHDVVTMYRESIHAKAIIRGNLNAATCNDCHRSHDLRPMVDPDSSIYKINVSTTCGQCHKSEAAQYDTSVHGVALARGIFESPTCNDCHGEHTVVPTDDPLSRVAPSSVAQKSCNACHDRERLTQDFGIAGGRIQSYSDSFHGLAAGLGDATVANCASCHGIHDIYPSSDARSTIHPENIQQTCGSCHPKFDASGVVGMVHGDPEGSIGARINDIVWWVYLWLIIGVIGFMIVHNFLDWRRRVMHLLRRRPKPAFYTRLNRMERGMHYLLIASFFGLAFTGFMLVFKVPVPFVSGEMAEGVRSDAHRVAAVGFMAWALWHAWYLIGTKRGRGWMIDMIPKMKDALDLKKALSYSVGRAKDKPRFARFGYPEKMEYLALLWGSLIMIATGLFLWFKDWVSIWFPFWSFDVATTIHLMEAILATLAIIIWHFYFVIFRADVAPMATWWLGNGGMTEDELKHHFPLEYERVIRERAAAEAAKSKAPPKPDVTPSE
ncbi:cytochrome c3 family protein [bacterium]|nr:cytochrome c3 family protein [bacterium]